MMHDTVPPTPKKKGKKKPKSEDNVSMVSAKGKVRYFRLTSDMILE